MSRRPPRCSQPRLHNVEWWNAGVQPLPRGSFGGLFRPNAAAIVEWAVNNAAEEMVRTAAGKHVIICPVGPEMEVDELDGRPVRRRPYYPIAPPA